LIAIEALGPHQIENLGMVEQARKAPVVFGLGHAGAPDVDFLLGTACGGVLPPVI
jgi:hypothetical protein